VFAYYHFRMPWKACCPAHDTPFDMLWALWTGIPSSFIAIGARDSFKTLTLAVSETLDIVHNACGVAHIGAIESQALKCYSYVKRNLRTHPDLLDKPPLMSRTELNNGGHLEILPCTINRVNSPHEPKVRFDEVELADPIAYNEAKFIASSDEKGNAASMVYTTTRKFAYGLAQQEVEKSIMTGKKVMMWCYKDVTARCPDERSGKDSVSVWIDQNTLTWSKRKDKNEMREYMVRNKCLDCKILPTCRGDLKNANGIKSIDDIILKFENASPDYWLAQMECLRPSRKGLMIHSFDKDIHMQKIDWGIFLTRTGRFNSERYRVVWGKDWGWNPDATVVCIMDSMTDITYVIREFAIKMQTAAGVAAELHHWCRTTPFGLPDDVVCDKSEPGLIATFQAAGFPMALAAEESDIEGGCDLINYLLKPCGGRPLLIVDSVMCPMLVWEMSVGYTRVNDPRTGEPGDKPKDANNHFIDALRYALWKHMRKYAEGAGNYTAMGGGPLDEAVFAGLSHRGGISEADMEEMSHFLLNPDN